MKSTLKMFDASLKMLYRDSQALLIALALPLIFIFAFRLFNVTIQVGATTMVGTETTAKTVSYFSFVLPGLVAMGLMNFAVFGLAVSITRFREQQILARIVVTPVSPLTFLTGQVAARLVLVLLQVGLVLVAALALGARFSLSALWLFVLAIPGSLIFLNIGFALAGLSRSVDAATGMANLIVLPLTFLSGVFLPVETLPGILRSIVTFLPLTPLINLMRWSFLDYRADITVVTDLLLVAGWLIVSTAVASRSFRLAPSR